MSRCRLLALAPAWLVLVCGACKAFTPPAPPRPLSVAATPLTREACKAPARPALADPRWRPVVTGPLAVEAVHGNPRLTIAGMAVTAWSPSSRELAVADEHGLVVWSLADGRLVALEPYPNGIAEPRRAWWSPDGRWVVISAVRGRDQQGFTVIADRTRGGLREIGRPLGVWLDQQLQFSADGKTAIGGTTELVLATGEVRDVPAGERARGTIVRLRQQSNAAIVELLDPRTGAVMRALTYPSVLTSVRVLDGGTQIAIGAPGELQIRALPSGDLVSRVPLPGAEQVAVSPDGKRVAGWTLARVVPLGGGASRKSQQLHRRFLAVWDVSTGRELWRDTTRCCRRYTFSADGNLLQHDLGSWNEELIDAATGAVVKLPGGISQLAFDSRHVLVYDRGLALWAVTRTPRGLAARQVLAPVAAGFVEARAGSARVETTADGPLLVVADRCVRLAAFGDDAARFAFDAEGTRLLAKTAGRTPRSTRVALWDATTGDPVAAVETPEHHVVALLPELARAAFVVHGGVRVVDVATAGEHAVARAPRVSYSGTSGLVWDVRDLDGDRPGGIGGTLTITADGRYLAGTTHLGKEVVTIWDLADPDRVVDLPVSGIASVSAIERSGRFVAAGTRSGQLYLWRRPGHRPVALDRAHRGWVRVLSFAPDARRIATGADDGTVQVFDTASGRRLGAVALVADRPHLLTWSPDGTRLTIDTVRRIAIHIALPEPVAKVE